jgi:hypothetical protein
LVQLHPAVVVTAAVTIVVLVALAVLAAVRHETASQQVLELLGKDITADNLAALMLAAVAVALEALEQTALAIKQAAQAAQAFLHL